PRERAVIDSNFEACPANSIDSAVMEKASNVYVECARFGWSDLGTWRSLYDNSPLTPDDHNVARGCELVAFSATGNIIATPEGKLVVVQGLSDYIVADTGDVLLICPKSEEQRIRQMVNEVQSRYDEKYL
ncbi:MAG: mannose-1-phosphate guanylyltransferase, partial [Duncaniella sp.]|nr:mannose-1-phosphate guanylyltransferase [Duncaniella sp.]